MLNQQLWDCIERIERLYCDDTITLLDYVLTDNPDDPQYSANTAYHCLEEAVLFERLYFRSEIKSVKEYLLAKGYGKEDIELLKIKMGEEEYHQKWRKIEIPEVVLSVMDQQLWDCIENIERIYANRTIELFDYAIDDSDVLRYSANLVYHRLEEDVLFERLYFQKKVEGVEEYLVACGYGKEHFELLKRKMKEEDNDPNRGNIKMTATI